MSICLSVPVGVPGGVDLPGGVTELEEYLSLAELGVAEFALLSRHLQQHRVLTGGKHPALDGAQVPRSLGYRLRPRHQGHAD